MTTRMCVERALLYLLMPWVVGVASAAHAGTPTLRWVPLTQVTTAAGTQSLTCVVSDDHFRGLRFAEKALVAGDELQVMPRWVPAQEEASRARVAPCVGGVTIRSATHAEAPNDGGETLRFEITTRPNCMLRQGDLVALPLKHAFDPRLLFVQIDHLGMQLQSWSGAPFFPEDMYVDTRDEPLGEMARVKGLLADLKAAVDVVRKLMPGRSTGTGPDAGRTVAEIFETATESDVIHALATTLTQASQNAGNKLSFANAFVAWVSFGRPQADRDSLALLNQYDHLVKLGPITVDTDNGTLNGTPIAQAMAQWGALFPTPDGAAPGKGPNDPLHPVYAYSLMGNALRFDVKRQEVTLLLAHRWLRGPSLDPKEEGHLLTAADLVKRLGAPTRVMGPATEPTAYLYARPYGTLAFHLTGDGPGEPRLMNFIHLYPIAPTAVAESADR